MTSLFSIIALGLFLAVTPSFAYAAGTLTVTQTPAITGSVPLGAQRIGMVDLSFKASCDGPVTVRTLSLHHTGLGAVSDIRSVYAVEGVSRISRGVLISVKSRIALLRPTRLTVDACKTRTLTVSMDLSASAASNAQHALALRSSADVQANATVILESGKSAPVTLTPGSAGSVTYKEVPTSSRNVLFGRGRTLLRFSLSASGKNDQTVDALTFTNDGSASDADLQNLAVYTADGTQVSDTAVSLDGEKVRIFFSTPLVIANNASRLLYLRGDVTASRRRTIALTIEETSDIEAHSAVTKRGPQQ